MSTWKWLLVRRIGLQPTWCRRSCRRRVRRAQELGPAALRNGVHLLRHHWSRRRHRRLLGGLGTAGSLGRIRPNPALPSAAGAAPGSRLAMLRDLADEIIDPDGGRGRRLLRSSPMPSRPCRPAVRPPAPSQQPLLGCGLLAGDFGRGLRGCGDLHGFPKRSVAQSASTAVSLASAVAKLDVEGVARPVLAEVESCCSSDRSALRPNRS